MKKVEVVDTGRLTEKEARMNMEKCAEFLARMIQKYGGPPQGKWGAVKGTEKRGHDGDAGTY